MNFSILRPELKTRAKSEYETRINKILDPPPWYKILMAARQQRWHNPVLILPWSRVEAMLKKWKTLNFHFKSTTLDMLISIYSVQQQTFPFMNHPVSNSVWNLIINVTQQDALKMQECMIKLVIPTALTKKVHTLTKQD